MRQLLTFLAAIMMMTTASAQTNLYFEDFEGGSLPSGWQNISSATDGGFQVGTATGLSSSAYVIPDHTLLCATNDDGCNCDKMNEYLITPTIDLSTAPAALLKFDVFFRGKTYLDTTESAVIEISGDNGTTWDTLAPMPVDNDFWQTGLFDVSAYAGNSTVKIAFHYSDGGGWLYGLAVDNVQVYIPPDHDVAVTKILAPVSGCDLTDSEIAGVRVKNRGVLPDDSIPVAFSPDNGNTENIEVILDTLQSFGDSIDYYFATPVDLSAYSQYVMYAYTALPGDPNSSNDSLTGDTIYHFMPEDVSPDVHMGFEDADSFFYGWSVLDNNNDQATWVIADTFANSGTRSIVKIWDGVNPADDWVFSRCLDLTQGNYYAVTFYEEIRDTAYPERMEVTIGDAKDPSSQNTILDLDTILNMAYEQHGTSFTVPSSGTYYLGVHCYSDPNEYELMVDDINIGDLQLPVANFAHTQVGLSATFADASSNFPDSWNWDFGDGNTGSGDTTAHTYSTPGTYSVCEMVSNPVGSDTICKQVSVFPLDVANNSVDESLTIFPNPAQDKIDLDFPGNFNGNTVITFTDMLGRQSAQYLRTILPGERLVLSVKNLPEGVYTLDVTNGDMKFTNRVVVTH